MPTHPPRRRWAAILAAGLAVGLGTAGSARASVITTSSTLPLLDVPYSSSAGVGCFASLDVCVTLETFTLSAPVVSTFNPAGQDIVTDATFTALLTKQGNTLLGSTTLTGSVEQEVMGRTFDDETGSWVTKLVELSLSGPLLGNTLTMQLDPSQTSSGTTAIVQYGGMNSGEFEISSFFDVFVELTVDAPTPRITSLGPFQLTVDVPEPASMTLLALPLLVLPPLSRAVARRRRR